MFRLQWMGRMVTAVFCSTAVVMLLFWKQPGLRSVPKPPVSRTPSKGLDLDTPVVACTGPRGMRLDDTNSRDLPRPLFSLPNVSYPTPTTGVYFSGLEESWLSFSARYGPYGCGEQEAAYAFPRVDWEATTDWGRLQGDCLQDNRRRFGGVPERVVSLGFENRFRLHGTGSEPSSAAARTGRQAIVMRSWSMYEYKAEDFWNLRSIITEAALATGTKYTVILLVDVKCKGCELIHTDAAQYQRVLEESVPKEFQNLALLFHESLLESWYEKVEEHKPFWQIMQPLQLLAHFYPEFDHFWQFEMDTRFTGNVGKMLEAFDDFSKGQPYKQALERGSWDYIPQIHGTYGEFSDSVDKAAHGGSTAWGPLQVKNVEAIGPSPPSPDPRDDKFQWLVGQEADLLLLGQVTDVRRNEDWVFKDWHKGDLKDFQELPRYMSVPAQARASWELLEGIHRAQHEHGLAVASEATLPSFAVWLGLKIVALPIPRYQFPARDIVELSYVKNGIGFGEGIANGPAVSRGGSLSFFIRPMTWDWWSSLCDPTFNYWMGVHPDREGPPTDPQYVYVPDEMPTFMREVNGTTYMPNIIMVGSCSGEGLVDHLANRLTASKEEQQLQIA